MVNFVLHTFYHNKILEEKYINPINCSFTTTFEPIILHFKSLFASFMPDAQFYYSVQIASHGLLPISLFYF